MVQIPLLHLWKVQAYTLARCIFIKAPLMLPGVLEESVSLEVRVPARLFFSKHAPLVLPLILVEAVLSIVIIDKIVVELQGKFVQGRILLIILISERSLSVHFSEKGMMRAIFIMSAVAKIMRNCNACSYHSEGLIISFYT